MQKKNLFKLKEKMFDAWVPAVDSVKQGTLMRPNKK